MTYRFADEALAEYIAAGRYYNQQVTGLGDGFADEVEGGIRQILSAPRTWRVIEDDARVATTVSRFELARSNERLFGVILRLE